MGSAGKLVNVNVRVPASLVARLDALAPRLGAAPELAVAADTPNRSDAMRVALLRGVAQLEAVYGVDGQPVLPGATT